ncbi:MAG: spore maturation protein [bacterium]
MKNMINVIDVLSIWIIPFLVMGIVSWGFLKNIRIYEAFLEGANESFVIIKEIFPALLAMLLAINIFFSSGIMDFFIKQTKYIFNYLDVPAEVIPLAFLRPLTGSGSLAYVSSIFKHFGPDSFLGKLASTIQGSTESTFYIIAVYFSAVGVKKYRYSIIVGILADIAGFIAAVFICNLLF